MSVESWKIIWPCSRAEAESLAARSDLFPTLDEPPVVNTLEPDASRPEEWLLEAFVEGEPESAVIDAVRALLPSAAKTAPRIERVPDRDWTTLSQQGLEPIRAGRFFVSTAARSDEAPDDAIAFRIEAGRAFGTGQHATTAGCLAMLDRLRRQGARVDRLIDVGTGTGLLAFAGLALWPGAEALASDIDPISIEVAAENAGVNGVPLGEGRGRLALTVADGLASRAIVRRAPYDLVIANILAQPLIELAPAIGAATLPGGNVLLAGLLEDQAPAVIAAYRRAGFRLAERIDRADQAGVWPTLRMRRRPDRR